MPATTHGGIGLTTTQKQTASNFVGFIFTSPPAAAGNNWVMVDAHGSLNNAASTVGATRPMLASEYSSAISNAHQLQLIAMAPGASYTLAANVNAAGTAQLMGVSTDVWGSSGFVPIGSLATPFTGTFDGLDHTVSTLTINLAQANVGLFGTTGTGAALRNVGLVGGSVIGAAASGGLVGNNAPGVAISGSFNTGSVSGAAGTGGLVGSNTTGAISGSYSTGSVHGAAGTGGLIGSSTTGAVSDSYASGSVNGGSSAGVGGLIGSNTSGTVTNSYATGAVSSTGAGVGALLGSSDAGVVIDSYWDKTTSLVQSSAGGRIDLT